MRWSYLFSRALILGVAWAVLVFVIDPALREGMVWTGETVFQAKVEVAELRTGFFPPSAELKGVSVANAQQPERNLFEFETAEVKLDTWAAARKKIIVEEGAMTGLEWNTLRDSSGALPEAEAGGWEWESINNLKEAAFAKSEVWLQDAIDKTKGQLDPDQLESVRMAKDLRPEWKTRFETLKERIEAVEERYKQVERHIKFAGKNPLEKARTYAEAAAESERILLEIQSIQQELKTLPKQAQNDFNNVELARQRDIEKLRQNISFLKLDAETISEAMLGEQLAGHLQEALEWGRWIQQNIPNTQAPEPERHRGQDILFTVFHPQPDLLVKRLNVSGQLMYQGTAEPFHGDLQGWTTQPELYGKPIELALQTEGKLNLALHSTIDRRPEQPVSLVHLKFNAPTGESQVMGNPQELALKYSAQSAGLEANIRLVGEEVTGDLVLIQDPVTLEAMSGAADKLALQKILAGSLSGINRFESRVNFSGNVHDLRWDVKSNIGAEISQGMSQALAQSWKAGQAELQAQANSLVKAEMNKLSQSMSSQYSELTQQLKLSQKTVQNLIPQTAGGNPLKRVNFNNLKRVLR